MSDPTVTSFDVMNTLFDQMHDLVLAMSEDQPEGLKVARVVQFASAAVAGAEHAAVSIILNDQQAETIATTGKVPLLVDKLQYELGEGPCIEALTQSDLVWSGNLGTDEQWPSFGPKAVSAAGVQSMVSYRLFLTEERRGALNFYSSEVDAFDQVALGVGSLFAAYASLTLLNDLHRDKAMQLERALESSREIGCAMGILMARELCTQEEAFEVLRGASQQTNRKLRDIAAEVTETGALPNLPAQY